MLNVDFGQELSLASMHLMSMEAGAWELRSSASFAVIVAVVPFRQGLLALAVGASATACEVNGKDGSQVAV